MCTDHVPDTFHSPNRQSNSPNRQSNLYAYTADRTKAEGSSGEDEASGSEGEEGGSDEEAAPRPKKRVRADNNINFSFSKIGLRLFHLSIRNEAGQLLDDHRKS